MPASYLIITIKKSAYQTAREYLEAKKVNSKNQITETHNTRPENI